MYIYIYMYILYILIYIDRWIDMIDIERLRLYLVNIFLFFLFKVAAVVVNSISSSLSSASFIKGFISHLICH